MSNTPEEPKCSFCYSKEGEETSLSRDVKTHLIKVHEKYICTNCHADIKAMMAMKNYPKPPDAPQAA